MDLYEFVESQELKRPFAAVLQHRGIAPVKPDDVGYTMQFSDMEIAWRDKEYHWMFVEDEGRKGLFQDVTPGAYIPLVRWKAPVYMNPNTHPNNYYPPHITFLVTKYNNDNPVLLSMDGMPGTGASIPPETTFPSSLETSWASSHSRNTSEVIRAVISRGSEWSDMMLGPIQMSETATLRFQFGGPNPHGCGGMWFDCVQLVPLQKLSRGVKRSVEGFAASQRPNFFSGLPELAMSLVVREARLRLIKRDSGDDVVELL